MNSDRSRLHRFHLENQIYHVTTATRDRAPVLSEPRAAICIVECIQNLRRDDAHILSFAVMPDHLHLLLIPKGERTLSAIMKSIKGYSSREINKLTGRAGPLWQQSFYDRMIRSESQLRSVIEYIEQNATKAALSDTPEAYPFSSAGKPT